MKFVIGMVDFVVMLYGALMLFSAMELRDLDPGGFAYSGTFQGVTGAILFIGGLVGITIVISTDKSKNDFIRDRKILQACDEIERIIRWLLKEQNFPIWLRPIDIRIEE